MRQEVMLGLIAVALWAGGAEAQQKLYRWTDGSGRVFYTDKPPPSDARAVEQKKLGDRAGTSQLPYESQMAMRRFPVTLFATGDCGESCTSARKLLEQRGVPYSEKDATDGPVQAEMLKLTGGSTVEVPLLMVGKTLTKGWESGAWNTALDAAGYPKNARLPPGTKLRKPVPKAVAESAPAKPAAPAAPPPNDTPAEPPTREN